MGVVEMDSIAFGFVNKKSATKFVADFFMLSA